VIAVMVSGALLLGPFAALGLWLWLRSRRQPIDLVQTFDIGRVMQRSFAVFGREGLPMAALAVLLVGVPQAIWMAMLRSTMPVTTPVGGMWDAQVARVMSSLFSVPMALGILALFLCTTIFHIAAIRFLAQRETGQGGTLGEALKAARGLLLPVVAVMLLGYLGVTVLMLLFIVPGVVMALSWLVAIPVMVNERTGIVEAYRRSRALAQGSRGRMFVAGLLILVMTVLLSMVIALAADGTAGVPVVPMVRQGLVAVLSAMMHAGFVASVYVELRQVREGFAVPTLAEVFA
jgi:hypothetical protein